MVETKWIVNILNGVHNKQLWNWIMKVDCTLEAYSGCEYTLLFYKIRCSPWENFLKTTALHQLSSAISLRRHSSWVVPSQIHVFLLTQCVCLQACWCYVVIDATETFVFWTNWMASVFRDVSLTIFTSFKFKWNKISGIKVLHHKN